MGNSCTKNTKEGSQNKGGYLNSSKFPYQQEGPTIKSGVISKYFNDGLLFQIVKDNTLWAYYNDTLDLEMHVVLKCPPQSDLKPLDSTQLETDKKNKIFNVTVYPGKTERVFEGKTSKADVSVIVEPLSERSLEEIYLEYLKELKTVTQELKDYKGKPEEEIIQLAVRKNLQFIDFSFPPKRSSLYRKGIDSRDLPAMAWARFEKSLSATWRKKGVVCMRGGTVEPNEIVKGFLGDEWFTCAIAVVAEFPHAIQRLFYHENVDIEAREHRVGCYRVLLNLNGWWVQVVIDDFFPFIGRQLAFARSADLNVKWVSLLQKAYAKAHGSYSCISSGDSLLAMQDLSGFSSYRFDSEWEHSSKSRKKAYIFFEKLAYWVDNLFIVVLNTFVPDSASYRKYQNKERTVEVMFAEGGIELGNTYTLLDCKTFHKKNLTLFRIRNPFGKGETWTGKWGKNSKEWDDHPEITRVVQKLGEEDHAFWMCWEDVKKYFDGGGVLFNHFGWYDYRIRGCFQDSIPSVVLELTVETKCRISLMLSQKDLHGLAPEDPDSKYGAIMLMVTYSHGEGNQVVDLNSSSNPLIPTSSFSFMHARDVAMEYEFLPERSPFLVIPHLCSPSNQRVGHTDYEEDGVISREREFVLALISEKRINSHFKCRFKRLKKDNEVFLHYPTFQYSEREGGASNVTCDYQFWKRGRDLTVTTSGTTLEADI